MIQVRVMQRDIDRGHRSDCFKCPIALALKRAFPRREFEVGFGFVSFEKGPTISLPTKAREFIDAFDNKQPVKPFTFRIRGIRK